MKQQFTRMLAILGLLMSGGFAAQAQQSVSCPVRLKTVAVTIADPAAIKGFDGIVGNGDIELNGIAVYAGAVNAEALVKSVPKGRDRRDWSLDGQTDAFAACLYDGGVVLARAVGRVKTCNATFKVSTDSRSINLGLNEGRFTCR